MDTIQYTDRQFDAESVWAWFYYPMNEAQHFRKSFEKPRASEFKTPKYFVIREALYLYWRIGNNIAIISGGLTEIQLKDSTIAFTYVSGLKYISFQEDP